jgi:hypothetical protein
MNEIKLKLPLMRKKLIDMQMTTRQKKMRERGTTKRNYENSTLKMT